jgi:methylmalonyl-CoA mutase cobalamin-binding domain/chain
MRQGLQEGRSEDLLREVLVALAAGVPAASILDQGLVPAMDTVGRLFREGEYFVPEVLIAARAMNRALVELEPLLLADQAARQGKVVMATVKGDMHDIGKAIVSIMVRGAGYEVIDLGVDVPVAKIVDAVREHKPSAVGLSALLTTTIPVMKEVIEALRTAGLRQQVKVLVGGAAVTQEFARAIGADGASDDAYGAVELLRGA